MESQKKMNNDNLTQSKNFCTPNFDVINTISLMNTSIEDVKQLCCTCTFTKVYGMPCVHALVVANTMKPHWTYVTHNDVSVRWLKSYYLYYLPEKVIPDHSLQKKN